MTQPRPRRLRKVKELALQGGLAVAITLSLQGCGEDKQEKGFGKGIHSYIAETSPGVFKITREELVEPDQAAATISYLNGNTETLSLEQARAIVMEQIQQGALDTVSIRPTSAELSAIGDTVTIRPGVIAGGGSATSGKTGADGDWSEGDKSSESSQSGSGGTVHHYHHGPGLGNVLFWGGMGYMMGRNMGYANNSMVYANRQAYSRGMNTSSNLRSSYTSRPSGGRGGFFRGGSSRGASS